MRQVCLKSLIDHVPLIHLYMLSEIILRNSNDHFHLLTLRLTCIGFHLRKKSITFDLRYVSFTERWNGYGVAFFIGRMKNTVTPRLTLIDILSQYWLANS